MIFYKIFDVDLDAARTKTNLQVSDGFEKAMLLDLYWLVEKGKIGEAYQTVCAWPASRTNQIPGDVWELLLEYSAKREYTTIQPK